MEHQICRNCGETKPLSEFDFRADTGRHRADCKSCRRVRQRIPVDSVRRRTKWFVGNTELLRCRKCGVFKPWTEFPRRGRDSNRLQTWCKPCFSSYRAERHQRNHDREMRRIRRNSTKRIAANRINVSAYLRTHACIDCGESDPTVLDFDHVRGTKLGDVSALVGGGYPWPKIEAEIAKCDVRCANCHRRATERRRRSQKNLAQEPYL